MPTIVHLLLALVLMWPLRHIGLALASSLSSYINVIGLCWLLHRRLGGPRGAEIWGSLGRTVAATAALALWCAWVEGFLPVVPEPVVLGLARMVLALVGGVCLAAGILARVQEDQSRGPGRSAPVARIRVEHHPPEARLGEGERTGADPALPRAARQHDREGGMGQYRR